MHEEINEDEFFYSARKHSLSSTFINRPKDI